MNRLRAYTPWILLMGLTLTSGMSAGWLSNRWGVPFDLQTAGAKLDNLPKTFGPWELQAPLTLNEFASKQLQCAGSTLGIYHNRVTGETVNMALVVGPAGPISVHEPEVCYSTRGYLEVGQSRKVRLRESERPDEVFWAATFRARQIEGERLHVVYGWNDGSGWSAPSPWMARVQFGGCPFLYKVLVAAVTSAAGKNPTDPSQDFLKDLLPVLDARLSGQPAT